MCDGADETTTGASGLAVLEAAAERLELETGPNVSPEALRDQLIRLRHVIDLLELPFASMVISLGTCDEAEWGGYPSPIQWVRHACKTSAWTAVTPAISDSAGRTVPRIVSGRSVQPTHMPVKRTRTAPPAETSISSIAPA